MNKNHVIKLGIIFAIFVAISVLIIVLNKFEFNVNYSKNVRIELDMGGSFATGDIIAITNEVYKENQAIVRSSGDYNEILTITVKDSTEEQNQELIDKINEKYETSFETTDLKLYYNSSVKGMDLIKPYIIPSIISGILALVFFGIRYRKLGLVKILGSVVCMVFGTIILYMALSSLFRMEINEVSIAGGIAIAIFSLTYIAIYYEKMLKG